MKLEKFKLFHGSIFNSINKIKPNLVDAMLVLETYYDDFDSKENELTKETIEKMEELLVYLKSIDSSLEIIREIKEKIDSEI